MASTAPAAPRSAPPADAPQGDSTRARVFIAGVAVVLAIAVLAIGGATLMRRSVVPAEQAVTRYFEALDAGQWRAAYTLLCGQDRATLGRDRFRASVTPVAEQLAEVRVQAFDPLGDGRPVAITLVLDDGTTMQLAAEARREQGGWKVCRLFG